jgi:hypothetical protein
VEYTFSKFICSRIPHTINVLQESNHAGSVVLPLPCYFYCTFHGLGPLTCSDSELKFETINPSIHFWKCSLDGGSDHLRVSTTTVQYSTTQHRKTSTYIHASRRFKPTIPVFERSKIIRASDRMATGAGCYSLCFIKCSPY